MTTTLPVMTETMDDEFVSTWYEIRPEAADNITDSNVLSAALKDAGCYKTQVGGKLITRTIRYGKKSAIGFGKGDVLPADEGSYETMATWPWKYFLVEITRSLIDDQQNSGPSKIKDYVATRMKVAREAMIEKIEDIFGADDLHPDTGLSTTRTDAKLPLSLFDLVPDCMSYYTDHSSVNLFSSVLSVGGIQKDNTWWQHIDFTYPASSGNQHDNKAGPIAVTMYDDLENVYNTIANGQAPPNLLIMSQEAFEIFSTFFTSKDMLIKEADTHLADLGYDTLRFHGKRVIWSSKLGTVGGVAVTRQVLLLNTDYIDIIYDPNLWFDMTEWRTPARQVDRVAYIMSSMQVITDQPRRHGRVLWDA